MVRLLYFTQNIIDCFVETIGRLRSVKDVNRHPAPGAYLVSGQTTTRRKLLILGAGASTASLSIPLTFSVVPGSKSLIASVLKQNWGPPSTPKTRFVERYLEVAEYNDQDIEIVPSFLKDDLKIQLKLDDFTMPRVVSPRNSETFESAHFLDNNKPITFRKGASIDAPPISDQLRPLLDIVYPDRRPPAPLGKTAPTAIASVSDVTSRLSLPERRIAKARVSPAPSVRVAPLTFDPPKLAPINGAEKTLSIRNVHNNERLTVAYYRDGQYNTPALKRLNNIFRDRRDNSVIPIDPRLFDQMHELLANMGLSHQYTEINLVSGYRSPSTNQLLRSRSSGVAKNSYHLKGKAVDFYVTGIDLSQLHLAALKMTQGGVGFYPSSNFIHLDTGPIRNWPTAYKSLGLKMRRLT